MSFTLPRLADSLRYFLTNPIILSSLISWFISQFIKGIVTLFQIRKKSLREVLETLFWRTGGMPSSHAAVVTAMTTAVALNEGVGSNLFAVSFLVALVVLRDAVGVRRAVGLQAWAINLLGKKVTEKLGGEFHPQKEIRGHTPFEVIVGAFLGIIVSIAYTWF